MEDYIKIQNLVIDYGESLAVDNINVNVKKGELVTLLGPSGCGKSTTLNALAGLITPTNGKIYFNKKDVTRTAPKDRGIGLVFQSYALYPHMTVYDNIAFSLKTSKEFKKKIAKFNSGLIFDTKRVKWVSIGLDPKEFDNHLEKINYFTKLIDERQNILLNIVNIANSKIKTAKELIESEKIKVDGKIKAISEKALLSIEEFEKNIKNSNQNEKQKVIDEKKSFLLSYDKRINDLKIEYKKKIPELKKQKSESIKQAVTLKNNDFKEQNEKYNKLISIAKIDFNTSLKLINKEIKKYKSNEKDDLKINEILSRKKKVDVEIDNAVKEVAKKVGITNNLNKKVTALSGGQQQRVAISRTLIKNPDILLLDEPLSNLDAKMRISTREWIRGLQQELGITTIFVTHDQEEAMSISDKIVCMSVGHVQQIDKPMDMYHKPVNKFVAGFLGMPMMNFFVDGKISKLLSEKTGEDISKVTFGCRPEHIKSKTSLTKKSDILLSLKVKIILVESFGREVLISAKYNEETIRFFVDSDNLNIGEEIDVFFKKTKVYVFSREKNEETIGRY